MFFFFPPDNVLPSFSKRKLPLPRFLREAGALAESGASVKRVVRTFCTGAKGQRVRV